MANASSKGYRLIDCEPLLGSDMNYCPLAFDAHRFRASEKGVGRMKDQKMRFRSCTPRRWGWGTPLKNVQAPESSNSYFLSPAQDIITRSILQLVFCSDKP